MKLKKPFLLDVKFLPLLGVLSFVCACNDPVLDISGSVHRTDGEPVSGATVLVDCGGNGEVMTDTAADGSFHGNGIADGSNACKGHVLVFDEPPNQFRPMDFCVDHDGDGCTKIEADLVILYPPDE